MKKQNFVFFFPDEMKASSVSCYGNPVVKMPNFDKFAEEGVLFETCIVQNPVCSPSRCSLMTGWYVHNLGHRTLWHLLRPHEPSLFRYLKQDGYNIYWQGKNDLYSQEYLDEILDDIGDIRKGVRPQTSLKSGKVHGGKRSYGPDDPHFYSFLDDPIPDDPDGLLVDGVIARSVDIIKAQKDSGKPFMLFIPSTMPHPSYSTLKYYHDMYAPEDVIDMLYEYDELKDPPEFAALIREYRRIGKWTKEFLAKIYAVYLGMNSYVDVMLGLLVDAVEEAGLTDNTTFIISSDHGDWAGNKGLVEKWSNAMDDDIVRIPLMIKSPGMKKGLRVKGQAALFDVMPTVLELAGIECGHIHFARSLVPELKGERDDLERPVFCEGGYDTHEPHCFEGYPAREGGGRNPGNIYAPKLQQQQDHPLSVCRTAMMRTLDYKLVKRTSGDDELYDLKNDPAEINNVIKDAQYAGIRARLESDMLRWYIKTSDVVPIDEDSRGFK